MIMPISSTNSAPNYEMLPGKLQQSKMLSVHRKKRFWTEARPFKRDYPDFDDDQEAEEYYRIQYRKLILPNIHNFSVKFTFTTRPTTIRTVVTKKIMTPIVGTNSTKQSKTEKPRNVTKKKLK